MTKNLIRTACACAFTGAVAIGCGNAGDLEFGHSSAALDTNWPWSSNCQASVGTCSNDAVPVTLSGSLTTSRGKSPISVSVSVDGGKSQALGTLTDADFTQVGPVKTATYSYQVTLTNGTHLLDVCFWQAGGGPDGHTMCDEVSVSVNCAVDECSGVEFFGDVTSNPQIGGKNPNSSLPVHVRGDLGDAPTITAEGPDNTTQTGTMRHAGDSCNYQYVFSSSTAGLYQFTVTGNGHTYTFDATVK